MKDEKNLEFVYAKKRDGEAHKYARGDDAKYRAFKKGYDKCVEDDYGELTGITSALGVVAYQRNVLIIRAERSKNSDEFKYKLQTLDELEISLRKMLGEDENYIFNAIQSYYKK